ncbi:MAG TPA: membrane protein insertion efficiency factor YidD [Patescibacteria group bacterium]|nr:membrane protein insertion efficiency factor YidD [Patescibacteria group bacterium]
MRSFVLWLLTGYQIIVSPLLHQLLGQQTACRYAVSCSAYAKLVIKEHGVLRGGKMALIRLLSCQPFSKGVTITHG